jgi:hypothetical protein
MSKRFFFLAMWDESEANHDKIWLIGHHLAASLAWGDKLNKTSFTVKGPSRPTCCATICCAISVPQHHMLITVEIQVSDTGGSTVVNWDRVTSHTPRAVASPCSSCEPRGTERSYTLRFVTLAVLCLQNSGPTSQKRHCISSTKTNQLTHYKK